MIHRPAKDTAAILQDASAIDRAIEEAGYAVVRHQGWACPSSSGRTTASWRFRLRASGYRTTTRPVRPSVRDGWSHFRCHVTP